MEFPTLSDVLSIHRLIVAETGGQSGLRDQGLLESALKAAENRHYYEEADVIACAATYAYHLCMAHAFIDGNKRVAAAVSETFLLINGWQLRMENVALVDMFLKIADGALLRDAIEEAFRHHAVAIGG
ncbi:death-on-curing family protein [Synechococcus sp. PCC 7335]|uniref:type II toxin-antitoxin system death-on-curing family toxin n=1 Tax=Synechococcus sp. (strain ATCC 29403 / PCC 7335) TaxID=91464 RepID=UPI00017EB1B8|nr:type II toxin-antitoxin system death-on-curing family toxin [Synechococcus sp. PCC 7335]EDX82661.1 death-on-curing family protein [Synechococcus sp. PCC 7335]EDX82874.1 death-on-curing family protein [Synechococcus sp. PCC 7335]